MARCSRGYVALSALKNAAALSSLSGRKIPLPQAAAIKHFVFGHQRTDGSARFMRSSGMLRAPYSIALVAWKFPLKARSTITLDSFLSTTIGIVRKELSIQPITAICEKHQDRPDSRFIPTPRSLAQMPQSGWTPLTECLKRVAVASKFRGCKKKKKKRASASGILAAHIAAICCELYGLTAQLLKKIEDPRNKLHALSDLSAPRWAPTGARQGPRISLDAQNKPRA